MNDLLQGANGEMATKMTMSDTTLQQDGAAAISTADEELVCAVFARDREQAESYRELLEGHGITVVLGESTSVASGHFAGFTVPVLVPDSFQESVSELIASLEVAHSDWDDDVEEFADDEDEFDDDDDDDDDDDFFDDDDDDFDDDDDIDDFDDDD